MSRMEDVARPPSAAIVAAMLARLWRCLHRQISRSGRVYPPLAGQALPLQNDRGCVVLFVSSWLRERRGFRVNPPEVHTPSACGQVCVNPWPAKRENPSSFIFHLFLKKSLTFAGSRGMVQVVTRCCVSTHSNWCLIDGLRAGGAKHES